LGGSRKGKLRKYLNIMLVFLISGLWHGAKFSFIAWGGLNGIYQIIGNITAPIRKKVTSFLHIDTNTIGHKLLQGFLTFIMVDFSWIFFRANSFSEALVIVRQMLSVHNPWVLFDGSISNGIISQKNFYLLIMCLGILLFADICKLKDVKIRDVILRQNEFCQIVFFAFSVVFLLLFGKYGTAYNASQFIYFQF
jgi:D-alanyl-lipoteichoic acid acyltransferase DltB (MBOAT superfamily)